jgi:threonine dehydrogenase-like Zn-dependent dehydrogenase
VIGAPPDRLALAREMGADETLDLGATSREDRLAAVMDLTGSEGADAVLEAAGAAAAIPEGLDLLRVGGRYVIAGHYTDVGDTTINAHHQINRKHLEIRGCWGSEPRHFLRALSILERHGSAIPFRKIGARLYGLGELNDALRDAEAMRIPKALVDPWM